MGEIQACESFLHVCRLNPYLVLYRVLASAGVVEILRVKHAAQQIP
ncbi:MULTISPECIES: type II toxin-antitoxin system RelE/ParE family toxin [Xanthomonas]|uniref:Type II toxin-antitoxin system RelE/ParE family toxin n=1 Tax=Xanthomonas arboricola pv. pruni TaxID=69929 RepID=A0ACC6VET2_9XANT